MMSDWIHQGLLQEVIRDGQKVILIAKDICVELFNLVIQQCPPAKECSFVSPRTVFGYLKKEKFIQYEKGRLTVRKKGKIYYAIIKNKFVSYVQVQAFGEKKAQPDDEKELEEQLSRLMSPQQSVHNIFSSQNSPNMSQVESDCSHHQDQQLLDFAKMQSIEHNINLTIAELEPTHFNEYIGPQVASDANHNSSNNVQKRKRSEEDSDNDYVMNHVDGPPNKKRKM